MTDFVSPARRSEIMSGIRAKGSKPEMAVRRLVHSLGYRYRLHRSDLPGTPDMVFPSRRKVIFVHGCFWHQHPGCKKSGIPKSNQEYWAPKLARNAERDREHHFQLQKMGWDVLVVWECSIRSRENVTLAIRRFLDA